MATDDPWQAGEGDVIKATVRNFTFEGVTTDYLFDQKGMVGRGLHSDWVSTPVHTTVEELEAFLGIDRPNSFKPIP